MNDCHREPRGILGTDHTENLIDPLCSLGVEKDLPLPAIAVIGDQGKSSVGEEPPRVALPRGRGDLHSVGSLLGYYLLSSCWMLNPSWGTG
uniref:Uncharacterized protein n=1 Tax=Oryzias sinensis TaxID=183150 RepID=A0A8C7XU20_9TELE